ncbi:hypothetical protein JYU14_02910 [Simkania negevensis]|uniref:Uncharacterized protein n=1 Tax=Simkania negevensis TaxID=83561 RepID=A0ABS3ATP8_9BACT|nr:hypothetical protein [Simkania negevensis]
MGSDLGGVGPVSQPLDDEASNFSKKVSVSQKAGQPYMNTYGSKPSASSENMEDGRISPNASIGELNRKYPKMYHVLMETVALQAVQQTHQFFQQMKQDEKGA